MRVVLNILLVVCFTVMMIISIRNQLSGDSLMNDEVKDITEVLYPSISICPKFPYHESFIMDAVLYNYSGSISTQEKIDFVMKSIYGQDELIYFMNHPGMTERPFPCLVYGGTDAGTPCSFPFVPLFTNENSSTCSEATEGTEDKYCLTKTDEMGNFRGKWGFCPKRCKGNTHFF